MKRLFRKFQLPAPTRRANGFGGPLFQLEDRVTPSGFAPSIGFSNLAMNVSEGPTQLQRFGYVVDPENDDPLTLSTSFAGATVTFTGNAGPLPGSKEIVWQYVAADGLVPSATTPVTVSVTDGTSPPTSAGFDLTVNNVTPVVTPPLAQTASAGVATAFSIGSFTDPGADANWTAKVDFDGDGTPDATYTLGAAGSLGSQSYTYAVAGNYTAKITVMDKDGAVSTVATFSVTATGANSYVDDDFNSYSYGDTIPGDIDPFTAGTQTGKFGFNAFAKIGDALPLTEAGGTVRVFAGTYAENIAASKAVSILGPNSSKAGSDITRDPEAIVTAGTNNPASGALLTVTAANVTVKGLTFDGDNTLISGGEAINGQDANANTGVLVNSVGNATVENNVLVNFTGNGVRGFSAAGVGGSSIAFNLIDNVPLNGPTYFGRGVLLQDNFYAAVDNNVISRVRTGVQTNNFSQANPGGAASVSNNAITASVRGIFHNLHYQFASPFTISGNTLTASAGAPAGNGGLLISSIQGAVSAVISGNNVSGFDANLDVWNIPTSAGITISGGTIAGAVSYGLNFSNFNAFGTAEAATHTLTLSGVTFTGTNPVAIRTFDSPSNTTGTVLALSLTGVTVNGGTATTGVIVDGADATLAGDTLGNTVFAGFTGTSTFVSLLNTAHAGDEITATAAKFNGTLGSALARTGTPGGFDVEDRLNHYLDTAGVGFIRTTADTVWVTTNTAGVQRGVDAADSGDTVHVSAGKFVGAIDVDKPLSLVGANAGVSAGKTPGLRGAETTLVPDVSDPDPFSSGSGPVVYVSNSSTVIDGFTIDGDNTGLTSTVNLNGANIDAAQGIVSYEGVGSVTVVNNIIKNLSYSGVELYNFNNGGVASGGNVVSNNLIDNLGGGGFGYGLGVLLYNNNYADVTGNRIERVRVGLQTGNYYQANPGLAVSIDNNLINADRRGIFYNLHYTGASPFSITNNTITGTANGTDVWTGLLLSSQQTAVDVIISGNTFDGSASNAITRTGVMAWNLPTTAEISVDGGTITGVNYGVWVNNYEGYSDNAQNTALTIDGVTISASTAGVYVLDSTLNTNGATVTAVIRGDTTITTGGGTGILVRGADASATITDNDNSISGNAIGIDVDGGTGTVTNNHIYNNGIGVRFTNGGTGSVTGNNFNDTADNLTDLLITATAGSVSIGNGNAFAGDTFYIDTKGTQSYSLVPATLTTFDSADNYTIEDLIGHRVDTDRPLATGLVTWVAKNIYVTAPGGGSTDSSIQRGLDVASGGDTVNVQAGTYTENVTVSTPVTILGPNAGIDPNTGVRVAEAILRPLATGISNTVSGQFLVSIDVPGVTIDGLLLDGDNTGVNSGNSINGADPDVDFGIVNNYATSEPDNIDAVIRNNIVRNINDFGIFLSSTGNGGTRTNSTIRNNLVDNILGAYGQGIRVDDNAFANITDNVVTRVRNGIVVENFGNNQAGNTTASSISGNTVEAMRRGVRFNLHYVYTAGGFTVANNAISSYNQVSALPQGGSTLFVGVEVESIQQNVPVTISNNSIDANRTALQGLGYTSINGIRVTNGSSTSPNIALTGNTIREALNGIRVEAPASPTISGNAIYDNATGVLLTAGGGATLTGNNFEGGANADNTTDLSLDTTAGLVVGGAVTGNTFAGTSYYIDNRSPGSFSALASANTYRTANAAESNYFTIENRINHKADNAAYGLVTVLANTVYVPNTQTIQGGIDAVPLPGTGWSVVVQDGTYVENPTVNKPVSVLGANQGADGRGARGAETIVRTNGNKSAIFTVTSAGATIDGFKLDGDDTGLAGGTLSSGDDTNATYAVRVVSGRSNVTVRNSILTHTAVGIRGDDAATGGLYEKNWFDSIGAYDFGYAITLRNDFYADVTDNKFTRVHTGLHTNNFYTAAGAPAQWKFTGNSVEAYGNGLWQGQVAQTPLTVDNNTFTIVTSALTAPNRAKFDGYGVGAMIVGLFNSTPLVFTNNTVTNSPVGVLVYEPHSTGGASIGATNTITGNGVGIWLTDIVANNPQGTTILGGADNNPVATSALTLDGLTAASFANNAVGVLVQGNNPSSTFPVTLTLANSPAITGGVTGLKLAGPRAKIAGDALGIVSFTGQTGQNLVLEGGAYNGATLDAQAAKFDGVTAGTATLPQAFAIEDKVTHQLDNAAQGFVVFQPNTAFVTQNSNSIQRGIDAEGIGANGIVNVAAGTFAEDLSVAHVGLQLLGAGAGSSVIAGIAGGPGITVALTANNQILDGFTITRQDPANTAGENSIGLSNNAGITGYVVRNNLFTQNRTSYYLTGGGGFGTFTRNILENSRTGIVGPETGYGPHIISENIIRDNKTFGIIFQPGATFAAGFRITGNSITGNYASQLENNSGQVIDARGNWFGTNDFITLNSAAPTGAYPGPLTPPVTFTTLSGTSLGLTDVSPFLWTGSDTAPGINGFQGDFTELGVTTVGGDYDAGTDFRVSEGVAYNSGSAATVHVLGGSYATDPVNLTRDVSLKLEGAATIGSLASTDGAGRVVDLNGFAFSAGIDGTSTTFNGTFVGSGASMVIKQGGGTFNLPTDNSAYTGSLAVDTGTVNLTGKLGGNATVAGTLTGNGTIGDVTVTAGGLLNGDGMTIDDLINGGTVSPGGAAVGTLKATTYTQQSGGNLTLDVNGPAPVRDTLTVTTGPVSLNGTLTVSSTGAAQAFFTSNTVIDNQGAGAVVGTFTAMPGGTVIPAGANNFKLFYSGGTGNDVTLFTVPLTGPYDKTFADDDFAGPDGTAVSTFDGVKYIGYDAFAKIQPAINNATVAGTIYVYTGTYAADSVDFGANPQELSLLAGAAVSVDGPLAATGAAKVSFNKGTFAVGGSASSTFGGTLTGLLSAGGFVKQGSGTLTLTNPGNSYAGVTKVNAGTLAVGNDEVLPDSTALSVAAAGTFDVTGYWETIGTLAGSGAVTVAGVGKLSTGGTSAGSTFAGTLQGNGTIIKQGAGIFTLTGASTFTGTTFVDGGTLQIGNGGGTGSLAGPVSLIEGTTFAVNFGTGTTASPVTVATAITGDGVIRLVGKGAVRLTGASSVTGGVTVAAGTMVVGTDAQLVGDVTLQAGTTLFADATFAAVGRTITADSTAAIAAAAGKTFSVTAGTLIGGTINGPGTIAVGAGGKVNGSVVGPFGTLEANAGSTLNTVSNGGTVTVPGGQPTQFNGFANLAGGTLNVAGTVSADGFTTTGVMNVTGTLVNGSASSPLIFGGGSITQVSPGGVVNVGTAGARATSALIRNRGAFGSGIGFTTIDYGARFAAVTGSADNNIVTANGGVYAPGSSPGASTSGGFIINGGGTYEFDLANAKGTAGSPGGWDLVTVAPTVFTPSSATLTFSATPTDKYTLKLVTRQDSGDYNTPGAAANFDKHRPFAWKFLDASHPQASQVGTFDAAAFNLDTTAFTNVADGAFTVEARDGGKNLFVVYTPNNPAVDSFVVNDGATQRSRITSITLNFASPVHAANYSTAGAITLTRTGVSTRVTGAIGDVVSSGPAAANHITVTQNGPTSLRITFDNFGQTTNSNSVGVESGSLSDGYWQLAAGPFTSTLNDLSLRRLYGDFTSAAFGTVDTVDLTAFGNDFNTGVNTFDFNNDGVINTVDLTAFGNNFGNVL